MQTDNTSALAMVGGLVVPPLLLGGGAGANLGTEIQQYLISGCLIWCAFGTVIQISRSKIWKTKYYLGTGLISVTGTSFAFANVGELQVVWSAFLCSHMLTLAALKYLSQSVSSIIEVAVGAF
jgi:xanthine/uracil permease